MNGKAKEKTFDVRIEKSVISTLLTEPERLEFAKMRGLSADDFSNTVFRKIYTAMLECPQGFSVVTIAERNRDISIDTLTDIMNFFFTPCSFENEVAEILRLSGCRKLIQVGEMLKEKAKNPKANISEIVADLAVKADEIQRKVEHRPAPTLKEAGATAIMEARNIATESIPVFEAGTEGRELTRILKKRIFVIAAQSGCGKTEMLTSAIVKPALQSGKRVLYICTESPTHEILGRLAGNFAGVPYSAVMNRSDLRMESKTAWEKQIGTIYRNYGDKQLIIRGSDTETNTPNKIKMALKDAFAKMGGVDVLAIDFLQDLNADTGDAKSLYEISTQNMREIKKITDEYGVASIVLSQINRSGAESNGKPTLDSLKSSGEIGHLAHCVTAIWKKKDQPKFKMMFSSLKTRNAEPFEIELEYTRNGYVSKSHKYDAEDAELPD